MTSMNRDYKFMINQSALGEERGTAKIYVTNRPNIGWNTMVPSFMSKETTKKVFEVPVIRISDYIKEKILDIDKISLIKIDTEGFEFPVLKGLQSYFEITDHRPVILCEIAPSAYPLLGKTVTQLSNYMKKYSYRAFSLINTNAEIDITRLKETTNVMFVCREI